MKRSLIAFLALPLLLATTPAFAVDYPKMTIRAATANPEGSQHTTSINKFKEIIERESGGNIKVQTFYGGSMGDEQANVKQLRTGEIHLAVLANLNLNPFSVTSNAFSLPYIFPTIESAYKLFSDDDFLKFYGDRIAAESNTRPLSWVIGGYRLLTNSKHPITKLDDLKNLKIRVSPVEIQLDTFKAWGIEAHPMAWSETFNALQQGVIDGQENPHAVNRDQKFWEVQDYITNLNYMLWVGPMLFSEAWYQKLDPATKALVEKSAREAAEYEWKWSVEDQKKALQQCLDNGMEITDLENEAEWQEKAMSIWPKYYDKVGGKEVIDRIQETLKN